MRAQTTFAIRPAQFNIAFGGVAVRYQLKQIYCRPWTLSGLSLNLIESRYET
jgi:hypothetical protein